MFSAGFQVPAGAEPPPLPSWKGKKCMPPPGQVLEYFLVNMDKRDVQFPQTILDSNILQELIRFFQ